MSLCAPPSTHKRKEQKRKASDRLNQLPIQNMTAARISEYMKKGCILRAFVFIREKGSNFKCDYTHKLLHGMDKIISATKTIYTPGQKLSTTWIMILLGFSCKLLISIWNILAHLAHFCFFAYTFETILKSAIEYGLVSDSRINARKLGSRRQPKSDYSRCPHHNCNPLHIR